MGYDELSLFNVEIIQVRAKLKEAFDVKCAFLVFIFLRGLFILLRGPKYCWTTVTEEDEIIST